MASAFGLDDDTLAELACNSFRASFPNEALKSAHIAEVDEALASGSL